MAQIHALTPEGRLPTAAVTHVEEVIADHLGGPAELGTTHLDTVTVPDTYVCRTTANAQAALGYPYESVPGTLVVMPWNPALPRVIAVFYPWSERPVAKRTSNTDGTWRPWVDMLGNPIA